MARHDHPEPPELADRVDEALSEAEADPAVRLVDRLHGEGVAAALVDHDPALDDLPLSDVILWPDGSVSELRAGFTKRAPEA